MKILHLNEHLGWHGGIETYLLTLVPLLEKRGCHVVIGYASGDGALTARSRCITTLLHAGRRAERECYQAVSRILSEERPDLVHVHNVHNIGGIAACLDTVPTVVTAHDYRYICPTSSLYYNRTHQICERTCGPGCFTTSLRHHCLTPRPLYAMRYYRRVRWMMANAQRLQCVIAPSRYVAARLVASGFPEQRVRVLPYFCPFEPADEPGSPQPPTLLFVGRFRPHKGVECFIRALALLPDSVKGLMVGDCEPGLGKRIMRLAKSLGCVERLELEGWASRQAIRSVYTRATVLAFPSLWPETLGIVGLEALACGVPVVASDVGGVREWLGDAQTGLLVPAGNPAALAEAVQRLLNSCQLRQSFGRNGIDLIRRQFSPGRHLDILLEIYKRSVDTCPQSTSKLQVVNPT